MAKEVILPRVDMDMATGKMGRWLVAEGERVREGQLLFEIETDKAAMEVEAPASGVLRAVRAQAGEVLPVGSVIGWIVGEDEPFDPAAARKSASAAAASAPGPQAEASAQRRRAGADDRAGGARRRRPRHAGGAPQGAGAGNRHRDGARRRPARPHPV